MTDRVAAEHERQVLALIDERDDAIEWADRLAYAVGGSDIGEHSNLNNPWQNALELIDELPALRAAAQADRGDLGPTQDELAAELDAALDAEIDRPPDPADLARWLQDTFENQPAITIRRGVEPQVAWRALADELLRRWGR